MHLKDQILKLRSEGKSYREIQSLLGCSSGTISYHCGDGQKNKNALRNQKYKSIAHPLSKKIDTFFQTLFSRKISCFHQDRKSRKYHTYTFNTKDVLTKFGQHTLCYLTGEPINLSEPKTYEFDHIIPVSKGGEATLENLGIVTKEANRAKHDLTVQQFIDLCIKVLTNFGYTISGP